MIEEIVGKLVGISSERIKRRRVALTVSDSASTDHALVALERREGTEKFFVKMARSCRISSRVEREANILKKLREMGVKNIPEILFDGSFAGRAYLVERFVEGTPLSKSKLTELEKLHIRLDWMREFYKQTVGDAIEPRKLIQEAKKIGDIIARYADLTDALAVLEKIEPSTQIPTVCWHGDAYDVNFVVTGSGVVAVDFGFSRFDEPPSEPYWLVPPATWSKRTEDLDLLSVLSKINPFFIGIYGSIMRLGAEMLLQQELEENLVAVDRIGRFPARELGTIEDLMLSYQESSKS